MTQPDSSYHAWVADDTDCCELQPGVHYDLLLGTQGIDPHADTPFEMLHTFYLGNGKYVWHETTKEWTKQKDALFVICLDSSSINGFSIPPARAQYLLQYKNSFIEKHFKTLQQLAIFHMHGMCSDLLFDLQKAIG